MPEHDADSATVVVEPTPEFDAIDRYERMIDVQIDVLDGINDRAKHLARLVGVLLGIVLTALSLLPEFESVGVRGTSTMAALAVAVGGLLSSLVFAAVTYLGSNFEYGASPVVARYFAATDLSGDEYASVMLNAYAEVIPRNERVVAANARRFRNGLASLFVGLSALSVAVLLVVAGPELWFERAVVLVTVVGTGALLWYVLGEEYLTLQNKRTANDPK